MKLEIKEKKDNLLLGRKEILALLEFDSTTPSNKEVQSEITKQLKIKDPNLVILKKIMGHYGTRKADVTAFIYSDADHLLRVERIKLEEEKKREGNASDDKEPKESAVVEEKKQETNDKEKVK